ncbi:MAG: hypothetical protein L0Y66_24970, partial [Myxococcaceae bacterium]|nr:hypothetical protein [Myxococcaceae bacterium]
MDSDRSPVTGHAALLGSPGQLATLHADGLEVHARDPEGNALDGLRYQLRQVARGSAVLWTRGVGVEPTLTEGQVSYQHARGIEERYALHAPGVEQTFHFDRVPAGEGDLVLTGRLEHEGPVTAAEDGGLRCGALRYGRALALDARGQTVDAPLAWADGVLEVRVPGEWLDRATPPVVIDPLIELATPPAPATTQTTAATIVAGPLVLRVDVVQPTRAPFPSPASSDAELELVSSHSPVF